MTECRHPAITVFMEEGGGPIRMWACSNCRIRFYPACKVCVSVGHRGEEHVEAEAAAAALDALATEVRVRREHFLRPGGKHVYLDGGIHAEITNCGECAQLHEDNAVLSLIEQAKAYRESA